MTGAPARLLQSALLAVGMAWALVIHAATPQDVRERVGLDEHLGRPLPLAISLRDETGQSVRLQNYLGTKPVILLLVYYGCPNLCNLTLNSLVTSLKHLDLRAGRDFEIVAVSIDPREQPSLAAAKRTALLSQYDPHLAATCGACDPGWHFLTGAASQTALLAQAVGFRFFWDPQLQQYAHPAGITIVTPNGRIARYFGGVDYPSHELRWALKQAAQDRVGSPTNRLWLLCYHYEELIGRYSSLIMSSLRVVGLITLLGLLSLVALLVHRSRSGA